MHGKNNMHLAFHVKCSYVVSSKTETHPMTDTKYTFQELAGLIADTMNFPGKDVPLILRRINVFDTKGFIHATQEETGRRERTLTPREAARAAILSAIFDCGISSADIEDANEAINDALNRVPGFAFTNMPDSLKDEDGTVIIHDGLTSIINGTAAGENWMLRVRFTRSKKAREVSAMAVWDGWDISENKGTKTADMLDGKTHLGTLLIPASDLIRPFLESAEQ